LCFKAPFTGGNWNLEWEVSVWLRARLCVVIVRFGAVLNSQKRQIANPRSRSST
jgi:hypothetical protein